MAKDDKNDPAQLNDIPHERAEPRPDFSKPLPRSRLPKGLQDTLESDKTWENVYEGQAGESTESSVRYAGYASRVRTILMSAHRYVAYTSDIGESFRPIAHPYLVKGAYGVSWAYLIGDVSYEGYKAYLRNQRVLSPEAEGLAGGKDVTSDKQHVGTQTTLGSGSTGNSLATVNPGRVVPIEDYRAVMAQRAVFQTLASMALPAFTIHSIVRYSGQALKNVKNVRLRTYGPIGVSCCACRHK